jgi:1-acyl-sn-glycerol-3-phosphate acyltransferase
MGIFYRQVEIAGTHHLPTAAPRIYVGNHGNSLIDPALALGWLPPGIRFLAKSTLWSHPAVGPLVRLVGAIPVYRRRDPGVDTSRNQEMFSSCYTLLAGGGDLALFPEGISHGKPHLMPLKTGAARIALGTLAQAPETPLTIVPFGLVFEERGRFRSRALIEIGEPIDPQPFAGQGPDSREAVNNLTQEIERALAEVTVNYTSWEEAHLVRRAAHLYQSRVPADSHLAAGATLQRGFAAAYGEIKHAHPEETAEVRQALREYEHLLEISGLRDRQVAGEYPIQMALRFVLGSLADLLILLPAGLIGLLINWLPYRIPGWVVARKSLEEDVEATYRVMISACAWSSGSPTWSQKRGPF